jgi:hypothetical protein
MSKVRIILIFLYFFIYIQYLFLYVLNFIHLSLNI